MESRIAIIGIIVEDIDASSKVNDILHDYGMYILGRMGIPYHEKGVNIISIAIDAPVSYTHLDVYKRQPPRTCTLY